MLTHLTCVYAPAHRSLVYAGCMALRASPSWHLRRSASSLALLVAYPRACRRQVPAAFQLPSSCTPATSCVTPSQPPDSTVSVAIKYAHKQALTGCFCPLQAEYWRRRKHRATDVTHVQYGNDVEGTAFASPDSQDPLGSGPWNMRVRAAPKVCSSRAQIVPMKALRSNEHGSASDSAWQSLAPGMRDTLLLIPVWTKTVA